MTVRALARKAYDRLPSGVRHQLRTTWRSLRNDDDVPLVVWALARQPSA